MINILIRGLSYQNGIFYIGKAHVSCAYHEKNQLKSWVKPLNGVTLLKMFGQVFAAMPLWFKGFIIVIIGLVMIPKLSQTIQWEGLPYYVLIYLMFGTHFIFPKQLKKYHGAEHKVFSYKGIISRTRFNHIRKATITNRNCSTNMVVIYFLSVIILFLCYTFLLRHWTVALTYASYSSLLFVPIVNWSMRKKFFSFIRKPILAISYFLQEKVTTTEPERKHIIASIESYRKLGEKEFPEKLKRKSVRKEVSRMAIVDVTVIPIGTETASVSQHVADIQSILQAYKQEGKIDYQLTPMSTIMEGELTVLFEVIQAIHEMPFKNGVQRVATNIRIDDRRDKQSTMASKLASVEAKLEGQ